KLSREGEEVGDDMEVGMMVEIGCSGGLGDMFGKEVDLFSIGTNELIEYSMGGDGMCEGV
ncbi:putative PEP-binding protein, partial [Staphylococcus hominis]|uniref:putative PEP-binding protein n=1 Tax=Staphylococcus hominis TaxID=1290 RepID=UPI0028D74CD7